MIPTDVREARGAYMAAPIRRIPLTEDARSVAEECQQQDIRYLMTFREAGQLQDELPAYQIAARGIEDNPKRARTVSKQGAFNPTRVNPAQQIVYPSGDRVTIDGQLTSWRAANERGPGYLVPVIEYHVPEGFTKTQELDWYEAVNANRDGWTAMDRFLTLRENGAFKECQISALLEHYGAVVSRSSSKERADGIVVYRAVADLLQMWERGAAIAEYVDEEADARWPADAPDRASASLMLMHKTFGITTSCFTRVEGFNADLLRGVSRLLCQQPGLQPEILIGAIQGFGTLTTLLQKSKETARSSHGGGLKLALLLNIAYNKYLFRSTGSKKGKLQARKGTPWAKLVAETGGWTT